MKIKTSKLIGAALDWAVCMAQGLKPEDIYISMAGCEYTSLYRLNRDEDGNLNGRYTTGPDLLFSSKWEAGGPIIEREEIATHKKTGTDYWVAVSATKIETGPTPLIAAMRCLVASKLGDEVEIPKELMQ